MIDLRHMRQFVAVGETLNFRKAALRLSMSQPPLSASIRRLEETLGVQLLIRNSRSTKLTPAGEVFLEEARRTLAQAKHACQITRLSAEGMVGSIRLGFVDSVVNGLLPDLLRRFQRNHTDVDIQLVEATPPEQMDGLRNDRLDIGILVLPVTDAEDIKFETLFEDCMVAALPEGHPLGHSPAITLMELEDEPWILFAPHHGPGMHSRIISACSTAGFIPRIVQRPRQMQTTAGLVAGNVGVALMPRLYALRQPGRLVCKGLEGPGTPIPYVLALAYRELSPCARSLRDEALMLCAEKLINY